MRHFNILLLIFGIVVFSSCEKDESIDRDNIIGSWHHTSDEYIPRLGFKLPPDVMRLDCYTTDTYYIFNDDGSFEYHLEDGNCIDDTESTINGTWKIDGEMLVTSYGEITRHKKINLANGDNLNLKEGKVKKGSMVQLIDDFGNPIFIDYDGDGVLQPDFVCEVESEYNYQLTDEFGNPTFVDYDGDGVFYPLMVVMNVRTEKLVRLP